LLLIAPLAALLTWLLYRKQTATDMWGKIFFHIKRVSRFAVFFILLFLLLSPILRYIKQLEEKPVLLLFLDDTSSVPAHKDSAYFRNEFINAWNGLEERIGGKYKIEKKYVTDQILDTFSDFKGLKTNLSSVTDYVNSIYKRENIGAVVVASDGIINRGINPVFKRFSQDFPLYTVGLGDTALTKDVKVKELNHNSLVYLNNDFNVIAHIQSFGYQNRQTQVHLWQEGRKIKSQTITFKEENDYQTIEFIASATAPGMIRYAITVDALPEEITTLNNKQDFFVEVVDGRNKILLVYQSPHPDIGALHAALQENKNYEVKPVWIRDLNLNDVKDVGLIVMHQLPGFIRTDYPLVKDVFSQKIPLLVVMGSQFAVEQLPGVQTKVRIHSRGQNQNDAQIVLNKNFRAFGLSDNLTEQMRDWPPLKAIFGQYHTGAHFEVLGFQSINRIEIETPLIGFETDGNLKNGWIFGEGLWRWRMTDALKNNGNPENFNELIHKIVQYIVSKEDKRKFRVYPANQRFDEDMNVRIIGELFDANFNPVMNKDVQVVITNEENKSFEYKMSQGTAGYYLDAGRLNPGLYRFVARVKDDPGAGKVSGSFLVNPVHVELTDLQANHSMLRDWALSTNGSFYHYSMLNELAEMIKNEDRAKTILKTETTMDELIKFRWLLLALIGFLSLEWFIRKWEGSY
jgi:hypothetical protein